MLPLTTKKISKQKRLRVNHQIRVPKVKLIDDQGNLIGAIETYKAKQLAEKKGYDLVEVAPQTSPPVCRLMDYGKYLYKQRKQEQKAKKKQKKVEIKGVRLGFRTGEHDFNFKVERARAFLDKGNRVKIEMTLRGRERAHNDWARKKLDQFIKALGQEVKIEEGPSGSPRGIIVLVTK